MKLEGYIKRAIKAGIEYKSLANAVPVINAEVAEARLKGLHSPLIHLLTKQRSAYEAEEKARKGYYWAFSKARAKAVAEMADRIDGTIKKECPLTPEAEALRG